MTPRGPVVRITLNDIKDFEAWQSVIAGLDLDPQQHRRFFQHGEYASLELEVTQEGQMLLVHGQIVERRVPPVPKLAEVESPSSGLPGHSKFKY